MSKASRRWKEDGKECRCPRKNRTLKRYRQSHRFFERMNKVVWKESVK